MLRTLISTAVLALVISAPVTAQTSDPAPAADTTTTGPRAPDGSKAFGFEPYFGVLGGYHSFDNDSQFGVSRNHGTFDGFLVGGVAGVNIPLGPLFVGVEGNAMKGFRDIDWEYGARGRAGFRAGETGLIFVSAGYQWVDGRSNRGFPDRDDWIYGIGVEFGPRDVGMGGVTGTSGPRFRLQVETFGDFTSIRPMGGIVFHF